MQRRDAFDKVRDCGLKATAATQSSSLQEGGTVLHVCVSQKCRVAWRFNGVLGERAVAIEKFEPPGDSNSF